MNDITDVLRLAEAIKVRRETNRLKHYSPYPYQRRFHELRDSSGDLATVRLLMAANQIGKCATVSSFITHPDGTRSTFGELYQDGRPFEVWAWNGEQMVRAMAMAPFRKPKEPCVRLWLESGHWFECALNHRVLVADGHYVFAEQLLESVPGLRPSSSALVQSVRAVGDRRWSRIQLGFLAGCLAGLRLCDGRLHLALGSVQARLLRLADAPERSFVSSGADEYSSKRTSTLQPSFGRPSSRGVLGHYAALCAEFLSRGAGSFARRMSGNILALQRLAIGSVDRLLSMREEHRHQVLPQACFGAPGEGNRIVSYEAIGVHEVYDFTVPDYANYCTSGLVHHNSLCAANEVAMHATGEYPDWWQGHRFLRPPDILVGSNTNETGRDICQKELFGDPDDMSRRGTGTVPRAAIGEIVRKPGVPNAYSSVLVKHISGGWSKVSFRAYEQGPHKHMGLRVDFGWMDEEPPQDIWSQYVRSILATNGKLILTFTPENGITQVVYHFMNDIQAGEAMMTATWADADHFKDPAVRARKLALIAPHEREMREKGIPVMGSGLVFPVPESTYVIEPIQIPRHFRRICGIDFGYDHPFAAGWIAHDPETDTVYIYDAYRERQQTPPTHAAAIKARGEWIPVAWPHDGMSHDKGSGIPLADQYRSLGVNMLKEKFSNPPTPWKDEGSGGQGVEVGLMEMLTRMETGRLKVFSTCTPFLEEIRMYHRKDGKIVKLFDDTISSIRYAVMSLRHATTQTVRQPPQRVAAGLSNWG